VTHGRKGGTDNRVDGGGEGGVVVGQRDGVGQLQVGRLYKDQLRERVVGVSVVMVCHRGSRGDGG
jgi:hypothetical protein